MFVSSEEPAQINANYIFGRLSSQVVGQDLAQRDLATLLAMHLQWFATQDIAHTAPNALIIGPTGVGKTHAIRTAAQVLDVPLVVVDSTRLAPHGAGASLESVLVELISAARRLIRDGTRMHNKSRRGLSELEELKLARGGIIFLDEFDKLAARSGRSDERNEQLQRRLLQFIDGTSVTLNPNPERGEEEVTFDTAGLLFIVAGAFTDLMSGVGQRSHREMRTMQRYNHVISEDFVRYGFMHELIARLPVIIEFSELGPKDLETILSIDNIDPSQFYISYLQSLGTVLKIDARAREWISSSAARLDIGARGLHQVLFPILAQLSQRVENNRPAEVVLDLAMIKQITYAIEEKRRAR